MMRLRSVVLVLVLLLATALPLAAQTSSMVWNAKWKAENKRWVAYHLTGVRPDRLDATKKLIVEALAPLGFNALFWRSTTVSNSSHTQN